MRRCLHADERSIRAMPPASVSASAPGRVADRAAAVAGCEGVVACNGSLKRVHTQSELCAVAG